jgi:hypothetical protein
MTDVFILRQRIHYPSTSSYLPYILRCSLNSRSSLVGYCFFLILLPCYPTTTCLDTCPETVIDVPPRTHPALLPIVIFSVMQPSVSFAPQYKSLQIPCLLFFSTHTSVSTRPRPNKPAQPNIQTTSNPHTTHTMSYGFTDFGRHGAYDCYHNSPHFGGYDRTPGYGGYETYDGYNNWHNYGCSSNYDPYEMDNEYESGGYPGGYGGGRGWGEGSNPYAGGRQRGMGPGVMDPRTEEGMDPRMRGHKDPRNVCEDDGG